MVKKYLFLDTNYFEHFPPMSNVDWLKLADCTSIVLLVPLITIAELNKHKDTSSRSKQRERAAGALRLLSDYSRQSPPVYIRDQVEIRFITQEPLINFALYRLCQDVPDDRLLAAAVEFAAENSLDRNSVAVATADLGLELKARARTEIHVLRLPDNLRLPNQVDEDTRRIRDLQAELHVLKAASPKLSLAPIGDDGICTLTLRERLNLDNDFIERAMEGLRAELPYLAPHPAPPKGWRFANIDPRLSEAYNQRLCAYFEKIQAWLSNSIEVYEWHRLTPELALRVKPATDVEIEILFPCGFDVLGKDELREFTPKPEPPLIPTNRPQQLARGLQADFGKLELRNLDRVWSHLKSRARIVAVRKGDPQAIRVCVPVVKHQRYEDLPSLFVHFDSESALKSFSLSYEILASDYPKTFTGSVNVVLKT